MAHVAKSRAVSRNFFRNIEAPFLTTKFKSNSAVVQVSSAHTGLGVGLSVETGQVHTERSAIDLGQQTSVSLHPLRQQDETRPLPLYDPCLCQSHETNIYQPPRSHSNRHLMPLQDSEDRLSYRSF